MHVYLYVLSIVRGWDVNIIPEVGLTEILQRYYRGVAEVLQGVHGAAHLHVDLADKVGPPGEQWVQLRHAWLTLVPVLAYTCTIMSLLSDAVTRAVDVLIALTLCSVMLREGCTPPPARPVGPGSPSGT
jgi:hypothetical protein